jgi:hypothetical protein
MRPFAHTGGSLYRIQEGVRRAKAADMCGQLRTLAEVVSSTGQCLGIGELPLDALRSPKSTIRRITPADETRWNRALAGAQQPVLPYPAITVQPGGERGTRIRDVTFDFGGTP